MQDETRLFFTVDSTEDNAEIFETLEEANHHFVTLPTRAKPRIYIAIVRNSYREDMSNVQRWNYEDRSDTFDIIKIIKTRTNETKIVVTSVTKEESR